MVTNAKHRKVIEQLKASDIYGCITGSSMALIDDDFSNWESQPDVDVFTYTAAAQTHAVSYLQYVLGFKPGKGKGMLEEAEKWKIEQMKREASDRRPLTTVSLYNEDGIIVNVSHKPHQDTVFKVIGMFDMRLIMMGYDIPNHQLCDMTGGDKLVAWPNMLKGVDGHSKWEAIQFIRQFDRVVKYWNRGYDTRPMAQFYLQLLDKLFGAVGMFATERSKAADKEFVDNYKPVYDQIKAWLEDKEDL